MHVWGSGQGGGARLQLGAVDEAEEKREGLGPEDPAGFPVAPGNAVGLCRRQASHASREDVAGLGQLHRLVRDLHSFEETAPDAAGLPACCAARFGAIGGQERGLEQQAREGAGEDAACVAVGGVWVRGGGGSGKEELVCSKGVLTGYFVPNVLRVAEDLARTLLPSCIPAHAHIIESENIFH